MAKVDKHLNKNLGFDGFGSRHFAKFVREFESAPQVFQTAPSTKYFDAETNTLLNSRALKSNGPNAKSEKQAFSDIMTGLTSLSSDDEVNKLAQGSEGAVFELKINNQDKIIKINSFNSPEVSNGIRKGEVAAAYFRSNNFQHVVIPTSYFIKVDKENSPAQIYEVHRTELKNFIREAKKIGVATNQEIELTLHGTKMDKAQGQPLSTLIHAGTLSDQDFVRFAIGLYSGVEELRTRGFVHHDIKPANVLFDSQTGSTQLIDLGAMVKLSNKNVDPKQSNERLGSPPFQAPAAMRGQLHGAEVDRFSYAMTLLSALEPKVSSPESMQNLSSFFGGKNTILDAEGQAKKFAPSEYLAEYVRALKAGNPNAAATLEAKFEASPQFKRLIEQSFLASAGGADGDAAWAGVHNACFAACDPVPSDIQRLNSALGDQYMIGKRDALSGVFSAIALEKGFNFSSNDFATESLDRKINATITNFAKKDGVPNSILVSHDDIRADVKRIITAFINDKIAIFSSIDENIGDDNFKAIIKDQFKFNPELKMVHADKMINMASRVADFIGSVNGKNIKDNYLNFHQLRRNLAESMNDEGMDFQQPALVAALKYAAICGVDMRGALNALMSQEAKDFYSVLTQGDLNKDSALQDSLDNVEDKRSVGVSAENDISFMYYLITSLSVSINDGPIDFNDAIAHASSIKSEDRDFILKNIYKINNG